MRKENLENISSERLLTAPEVIYKLLETHPEIIQISVASYPPHPHGERPGDFYREYIPVSYEGPTLARGEWRITAPLTREVVAIGSTVDICPSNNCNHSPKSHFEDQLTLWEFWHDEGCSAPHGYQKSFIFLDIETKEPEISEKITEVLKDVDYDWYMLNSGGGFHVILDRLVNLGELPTEYGKIIAFFGDKLGNHRLKCLGENLEKIGNNPQKLLSWVELVLEKTGHVDDPIYQKGKELYIIDLRHVAVSLEKVQRYLTWLSQNSYSPGFGFRESPDKIGGFYLRISPKKSKLLPPTLVAQKTAKGIQCFRSVDDLLKSQRQKRLF